MTSSNSERRALADRFVALGDPTVVPDTSARLRARSNALAAGIAPQRPTPSSELRAAAARTVAARRRLRGAQSARAARPASAARRGVRDRARTRRVRGERGRGRVGRHPNGRARPAPADRQRRRVLNRFHDPVYSFGAVS